MSGWYELNGERKRADVVGASLRPLSGAEYALTIDEKSQRVRLASNSDAVFVHAFGRTFEVPRHQSLSEGAGSAAGGGNAYNAPMPGTVVAVSVEVGQAVSEGQSLMVIESMKLQTTIAAWRDGVIASVDYSEGNTFDKGAVLLSLKEGDE